jgi:tetratricopeptide (TPR) repeat protein
LALLSFLIDGQNWPTDAWPFKRTNLIIHLINGALLGVLTSQILRLLDFKEADVRWIAWLSTAAWLLHPFLVSTTLYVVQRMAQLSTMFIFAGLIGHLYGRSMLQHDRLRAYLVMTGSIGIFTILSMISKENGILLPTLIGVIEFTVLPSLRERIAKLDLRWTLTFIVAPTLIILAYLADRALRGEFFDNAPLRDFSLYERFLTESRILFDYLQHWFMPKLYTTGVFQDHYIKSTGFFTPATTVLSIVAHVSLITAAIVYRRKWPLAALAMLFFYAGHLLESTVLNLELYFEHRNYLPACFLFVPIVAFLCRNLKRQMFVVVAVGTTLLLSGFTRYSATIWQDFSSMAQASAQKAPTSARAQAEYARDLFNANRYEESLRVIDTAIANIPAEKPHLLLNRLMMLCRLGILDASEFEKASARISNTVFDPRLISIYQEFSSAVIDRQCDKVTLDALRSMFMNMLKKPENSTELSVSHAQIRYFAGFVDVHNGKPEQAVAEFEASLQVQSNVPMAMNMAALLATNTYFEEALHLSDIALDELQNSENDASSLRRANETAIREFQEIVRADLKRAKFDDTTGPAP